MRLVVATIILIVGFYLTMQALKSTVQGTTKNLVAEREARIERILFNNN